MMNSIDVGGKASSLLKLREAGFPVPAFAIIPTAIFRQARGNHFSSIPSDYESELNTVLKTFPFPVAVRSSASKEDGGLQSFAGLFETYLDIVGEENIKHSILKCWQSTHTERTQSYCEKNGVAVDELEMAVVIQEYVEPDYAGVLFTINPITGDDREILIEACPGSGEKLVSGLINPSRFILHRFGADIVKKADDKLGINPEDKTIAELKTLALQIQAYYGSPQDIEFAVKKGKVYILQSRPVTSIQFSKEMGEWTTSDFRDGGVSSAVVSPVMWSLYEKIFASTLPDYFVKLKLISAEEARKITWYKVFYGRPYWNLRAVKDIQETLPGYNERNFDTDMALPINYEGDGVTTGFSLKGIMKALPVLGALHKEYDLQKKRSEELIKIFSGIEDHYQGLDLKKLSNAELFASFKKLIEKDFTYVESEYFQTIYNASNAKLEFSDELKFYKKFDPTLDFVNLISELGELKVTGPAHFLTDLRKVWPLKNPSAQQVLNSLLEKQSALELEDLKVDPYLHERFSLFCRQYYFHSERELDLLVPRWSEDLRFALKTLQTLLATPETSMPEHKVYDAELVRLKAAHQKSWKKIIPGQFKGVLEKLERIRTFLWLREEVRDRSTRMYYFIRVHLLEMGKRTGLHENIFYLSWQEIFSFIDKKLDLEILQKMAENNRLYAEGYKHYKNKNEIGLRFNQAVWKTPSKSIDGKTSYFGIGCSAGVIKARACVINDIAEASKLKSGEIMIVPFTDPGWTPLFSLAAGVVTETGGLLSHAALISREYGIPCVLNINGATESIPHGAMVELDGNEGRVTIL